MWDFLYWPLLLLFLAALIAVGALLVRGYLRTGSASGALSATAALAGSFFGPKPEPRLEVVEQANVDGRRRLVLIRRDDVEHLIMTGGPIDLVIETGIGQPRGRASAEVVEGPTPIYSRPPRPLGQAVGDQ